MPPAIKKPRTISLNSEQRVRLDRLYHCRMLPGSWDKRFVRNMSAMAEGDMITIAQSDMVDRLYHRYRKQVDRLYPPERLSPREPA